MGEFVLPEGADLENSEKPKQKSNIRKGAITVLSAAAGWAIA
jgi:hypothetical protein